MGLARAIGDSIGTAIGIGLAVCMMSALDFGSDAILATVCVAYIFQPFFDKWIAKDRRYA